MSVIVREVPREKHVIVLTILCAGMLRYVRRCRLGLLVERGVVTAVTPGNREWILREIEESVYERWDD